MKKTFLFLLFFIWAHLSWALEVIPVCHYHYVIHDKPLKVYTEMKEMKIMTYNTLNLEESVGKYVDEDVDGVLHRIFKAEKSAKPEWQQKMIADIIKKNNPDFLFLQEIEGFEAINQFNNKYLDNEYHIFQVKGNDTRGIDNVILMKKDMPFIVEMHSYRLDKIKDPLDATKELPTFSRDFPVLLLRTEENSEPVMILGGVHLKSQRDRGADIGSGMYRAKQVEETMKILNDYQKQYPKASLVIGGDFNADLLTKPEFKFFQSSEFKMDDAFELVNMPMQERITHSFHPRNGPTSYSQLDAFKVHQIKVKDAQVIRYKEGPIENQLPKTYAEREQNPSDHFPVVITLELPH